VRTDERRWPGKLRAAIPWLLAPAALAVALIGAWRQPATADSPPGTLHAVASTNVYADVLRQIGGPRLSVFALLNNPNADPHTFETNTADAAAVQRAVFVVRNGLGYDDFLAKLEDAAPNGRRTVLDAGASLDYTPGANPHIWYSPATMPRLAALMAASLSRQDPAHAAAYAANLRAFDRSLRPWTALLATLRRRYAGTPVAVTEPVFGYELQALGLRVLTPAPFAMAIMQGNDPAPQDAQAQEDLLTQHRVRCLFYNQQAVAPVTSTLRRLARAGGIPVVGVYETKPARLTYQQWMMAETTAVQRALAHDLSTETL
jgi:zinc/manganese transport system substrate-binding protein